MNSNDTTQDSDQAEAVGVDAVENLKPQVPAMTARRDSSNRRRSAWRRTVWTALRVSIIAAAVVGGVYWMRFAPITVSTEPVREGTVVAEVLGTGTLEAHVQATISPKISGRLNEVLVDQGDEVQSGDVLVRLDDAELQQQVAVAEAGVAAAQATIGRVTADKGRAQAVVVQAERQHKRIQSLAASNATTQASVDEAIEALDVAQAGLAQADAAIVEAQQQLVVAQKTLSYQQARLADAAVTAPFDGLIVNRQRDPGDVAVPGSAVLTLISTDELWISAWVDETEMDRLKVGQPARVVFRSQPDDSWPGEVVRLGREADRETREFIVDVRVRDLPPNWAVGQRAEVYIETARREDVVLLPTERLLLRDGHSGMFVRNSERAEWRHVTIGLRSAETVEITSGLQKSDQVLIPPDGTTDSFDGRKVVVP